MQLSSSTISKFGLGTPEVEPPDPVTHIPTIGVGSSILYSNNPSSTAVYDPNADSGGFMKDLNTGADIRPNGSNVFSYKAPKQITSAKSTITSSAKPNSPFLNTGTVKNSFTSTTQNKRPITRVSVAPTYTGATAIKRPSSAPTGKVISNTAGMSTKKPSTSAVKLATTAKPTINSLFTTINKILGNIMGRR